MSIVKIDSFLPEVNPEEFFLKVSNEITEKIIFILDNFWYFNRHYKEEELKDVEKFFSNDNCVDRLRTYMGNFNNISELLKVISCLNMLEWVDNLFIRLISEYKFSESILYRDDFSRIPWDLDFKEIWLYEKNVVVPDVNTFINPIEIWKNSTIYVWYNSDNEEIKQQITELIIKFWSKFLEIINYNNLLIKWQIDSLTKLPNRSLLSWKVEEYEKTDCVLLEFDLDKFKSVNDTYWHETWDRVLLLFSKILLEVLEEYENWLAYRLWWEEFMIVIPWKFKKEEAEEIAKKVKNKLDDNKIILSNWEILSITCSTWVWIYEVGWNLFFNEMRHNVDMWTYIVKYSWRNWHHYVDNTKKIIINKKTDEESGENKENENISVTAIAYISLNEKEKIKRVSIKKQLIIKLLNDWKNIICKYDRWVGYEEAFLELFKEWIIDENIYNKIIENNPDFIKNPN